LCSSQVLLSIQILQKRRVKIPFRPADGSNQEVNGLSVVRRRKYNVHPVHVNLNSEYTRSFLTPRCFINESDLEPCSISGFFHRVLELGACLPCQSKSFQQSGMMSPEQLLNDRIIGHRSPRLSPEPTMSDKWSHYLSGTPHDCSKALKPS
jgi:hypothetical protein